MNGYWLKTGVYWVNTHQTIIISLTLSVFNVRMQKPQMCHQKGAPRRCSMRDTHSTQTQQSEVLTISDPM